MIARRTALALLSGGLLLASKVAAQSRSPRRRGVLSSSGMRIVDQLREGLRRVGLIEGRDIEIVYRVTEGGLDGIGQLAAELVAQKVDVIVASATPSIQAAMKATRTVPIVMMTAGDALGSGLVQSLARPGGNVTGLSLMLIELAGKLVELLVESAPALDRVACLVHAADPLHRGFMGSAERAAAQLKVGFHPAIVRRDDELPDAFADMAAAGTKAVVVQPIFVLTRENSARIANLAMRHRMAAATGLKRFAAEGGMLAYAAEFPDMGYRAARFVDLILRGANPAELPVERPTEFTLSVNLKTSAAIGLTIAPRIVARADEVIE